MITNNFNKELRGISDCDLLSSIPMILLPWYVKGGGQSGRPLGIRSLKMQECKHKTDTATICSIP